MQVFRRLRPIAAISFDLDDTLYDNRPVIAAAEQAYLDCLQREFPLTRQWGKHEWRHHKLGVMVKYPRLSHDPTALRLETLKSGLRHFGLSHEDANAGAEQVMAEFVHARSNFRVPDSTLQLLSKLKRRYPLIGLTNGNVDPTRIGLQGVLDFVLSAGDGNRMKPHPDLFAIGCDRLGILPSALLHVGDSHSADVQGALRAGCQAVLLNPGFGQTVSLPLLSPLPHLQISRLHELEMLL
ncbi:HAD-IA family hydrolase [Shewanella sp.]|uniref:HAD-IA family hydrolase n=1 Tax=Shewanella sp. TaxID=50422 RepID=UPI00356AC092